MKIKIKPDQDFISILNFIHTTEGKLLWDDLVQYCLDYDIYKQLYTHRVIIEHIMEEKNAGLLDEKYIK